MLLSAPYTQSPSVHVFSLIRDTYLQTNYKTADKFPNFQKVTVRDHLPTLLQLISFLNTKHRRQTTYELTRLRRPLIEKGEILTPSTSVLQTMI
jgi:hypothetical protein